MSNQVSISDKLSELEEEMRKVETTINYMQLSVQYKSKYESDKDYIALVRRLIRNLADILEAASDRLRQETPPGYPKD